MRLTVKERILLHLLEFQRPEETLEVSLEGRGSANVTWLST
jgi:hypothetical protein